MTKTPVSLQDLRRRIYVKAKAEPSWRFWGLYVHVCKEETLQTAYRLAKKNNGAPGIDGVTFEAIEAGGVGRFLQADSERNLERARIVRWVSKGGDPEGRRQTPWSFDSRHSGPGGPGSAEAHPGADLRG